LAPEPTTLKVGADPHALDLGLLRGAGEEGTHRHQLNPGDADQELTAGPEVGAGYVAQVVLPGPVATVRAGVLERCVVELPHRRQVTGLKRPQLEHRCILPQADPKLASVVHAQTSQGRGGGARGCAR
jgi:hypothetical protein